MKLITRRAATNDFNFPTQGDKVVLDMCRSSSGEAWANYKFFIPLLLEYFICFAQSISTGVSSEHHLFCIKKPNPLFPGRMGKKGKGGDKKKDAQSVCFTCVCKAKELDELI